ncbi:xanthine dehydrogenase family protein molybdopterin-binding subunit [Pararhizobium mangrovi]|uniref:Xanthine dehydrogenase family protein molybdopterin-binding subunit n=1 Tax=Pararhizobium mangrovi TaxID=2590452 RepID=A0A506U1M6_9HYPH|nr:xanthine dehydrogenase family protein molybdopterin-binding subunit [Pararhizobium mangrovi]TPW27171.1 xanthine dehydrogenase family protein molybdopterin-binding subunit [Pararhizobium mangrovi]
MRFDKPAGDSVLADTKVIGKPVHRVDGPLKTTGTAPYAYERHDVAANQLVGWPVGAAIAKGKLKSVGTKKAEAAPGVVAVLTTLQFDRLPLSQWNTANLFGGDQIEHYHQAVALVVAETLETARAGAAMLEFDYAPDTEASFDLSKTAPTGDEQPLSDVGNFEKAYADAPVTIDVNYTTPAESHAMMEPHASIAAWDGDEVTLWTSNQMIQWDKMALATTLKTTPDKVRIDSPYIGGGFGSKLFLRADAVLAALGAKRTGKPVKVQLPRPMIFNNTTHRGLTEQHLKIGATQDGKIVAISHENKSNALPGGSSEKAPAPTQHFYATDNLYCINRTAEMHLPESNAMRAPGEASGLMALEAAMDELAEKLDMDPVELRIMNDAKVDPSNPNKTFSRRHFVECLRTGADRFGWSKRNRKPGDTREGAWLIGHGVAGAYRGAPAQASGAEVAIRPDGGVVVRTDMTDIGTGSYTILAQTAAEMLGVPVERVRVELGDSRYPVSSGSGGQFGAVSSTAGVYAACVALRKKIADELGKKHDDLTFADGAVHAGGSTTELKKLTRGGRELSAIDTMHFGDFRSEKYVVSTFGAHFIEARVHSLTGEVRLNRMLAVCDAGRILNPITARSQVIGAMTMGAGAALLEEMAVDHDRGFFVNHDLAGYEVPVHLDIPHQEVVFLDVLDPVSTPLKAKGVGELGICGVAAAIANAVNNATGIRVRDYPITLDKIVGKLPTI